MPKGFHNSTTDLDYRQRMATPPDVFEHIQKALNIKFDWDVCAEKQTSKTGEHMYYGPDHKYPHLTDALTRERWSDHGTFFFMNPPYNACAAWCHEAQKRAFEEEIFVVGLLPDDISVKWFHQSINGVASLCLLPTRRIQFLHPDTGEQMSGNNRGSLIPLWTPWRTGQTIYRELQV